MNASAPLRVLILTETFHPEIGGGERQAALLAQGLQRRGHAILLIARRSRTGLPAEAVEDGIRIVRLPPVGAVRHARWGMLLYVPAALWRLRLDYDVLLVSGYRALGIPAVLVGRGLGKPVVLKADSLGEMSGAYFRPGLARLRLSPDGFLVRTLLRQRNWLLRRAAAQVAISGEIEAELRAAGIGPAQVWRIPNGVDTVDFRPAMPEERSRLRGVLGLPPGPVIVYTGRLVSYKGLPLLLDAFRELGDRWDATLVLVGEGGGDQHNCEAALRDQAGAPGLGPRVRFAGAVTRVEDWLRAADCYAFPTENEAFGLALVEAMACGLPAVTTRVGGLADYVEPDVNALVIEPGDRAALVAALEALLGDPRLRARLGAAARDSVCARFGEDAVAAHYERLLAGLATPGREAA